MKRLMLWVLALCLLLYALPVAQASGTGGLSDVFEKAGDTPPPNRLSSVSEGDQPDEPTPAPSGDQALFDEGVRVLLPRTAGNTAHYLNIGGWMICNGFVESTGNFALIGYPPSGGAPVVLCKEPQTVLIPAGDAIIYVRQESPNHSAWVLHKPGEDPQKLPFTLMDAVFYADDAYIWYTTIGTGNGSQKSIRTLNRKNVQKEGLARFDSLQIFAAAMLDGGGVLLYDRDGNRVLRWQDGATETLMETEEPILDVFSTGQEIWVELEREIGLVENGSPWFRIPGNIAFRACAAGQTVLLLGFLGSDAYDVLVLNDAYRAYARLGYAPAVEGLAAGVTAEGRLLVRTLDGSVNLSFDMPPANEWIPYGFYDMESARETVSFAGMDETVIITVEAALVAWVSAEDAQAEAEKLGIYFAGNRDGSFTYTMTPEQQRLLLDRRRTDLQAALERAPGMFAGLRRCEASADWREVTLYVTSEMDQSTQIMASTLFGLGMAMYRALSGEASPRTLVHVIDADTGANTGTFRVPSE